MKDTQKKKSMKELFDVMYKQTFSVNDAKV